MSLSTFLFSEYRRKVLALMLLHPDEQYHQREIARLTDTISGTLSRELTKMVDAGLLLKIRVGNQVHYRANRNCLIFEELASILRKTDGWLEEIARALQPLRERIKVAFVFGSMASGKAGPYSDIDLMVIGDAGFSDLITHLYPLQETFGREINPKQYPQNEWRKMLQEQGAFVREVMSKPKLFVIGMEHDLESDKE
ncbi:Nucleotidyltransferase domain protein [compost metagenome]